MNVYACSVKRQQIAAKKVYYYTTPAGYVVNFYLPESGQLVQVAQSMDNPTMREREIRALGVNLVAASICYLVDLFAAFLPPDFARQIHSFIVIVPAIAEIWMVLYLLVVGVKTVKPDMRKLASAAYATTAHNPALEIE
jgi:hypothetical protein